MYHYPIIQLSESTPIHLTCPDFKNLSIIVTTAQEAHAAALEGLITALTACVRQRSKIPPPSNVSDPLFIVRLPLTTMAKIMLWNTLCEEGVSRAELARRLGCTRVVAIRLVDFTHPSKMGALEHALSLLGRRLLLQLEPGVRGAL